jgi:hypothetical protein
MPNTSIISTVASEFSLYLSDCEQQSYDFNIEVRPKGHEVTTFVRLLLEGDGLSVWVKSEQYDAAGVDSLEGELYDTIRYLPIVKATIRAINLRHDDETRQAL